MRALAILLLSTIGIWTVGVSSVAAQPGTGRVTGSVVAATTGEPLPYSIVRIVALEREHFADDSGRFAFGELPSGSLRIHVRRLGYSPAEVDVYVRAGSSDTVRVELTRLAVTLASVEVRAYPPCTRPGIPAVEADSTLATILSQVVLNAEQYRALIRAYPFQYAMEITQSRKLRKGGQVAVESRNARLIDPKPTSVYRPGEVIKRRLREYFFGIPGLNDFADTAFLASHCFHYAGLEGLNEADLIRIDFQAAAAIKEPDVDGSIYLDPANFQIRRSALRLSRPFARIPDVTGLEVTTDFGEVVPSVPVITNIWSVQSINPRSRRNYVAVYDHQRLIGVQWAGMKPGEQERARP